MRITRFEWDIRNEEHIAEHGVEPEETEDVFFAVPFYKRGRRGYYYAYGQTGGGRYLFVVFDMLGKGKARVITARDMTDRERRYYRRNRR